MLRAHWRLAAFGLLLLALAVQTLRVNSARAKLDNARIALSQEREGRIGDRKAYEDAQKAAAAKNQSEVQRITTEQEKISAEQKSKYRDDLARLRAGGLRKEFAAPPGSPGKPQAGADGGAACRADDPATVCIPRSLLLQGAETELKLLHLQRWLNEQLQVVR